MNPASKPKIPTSLKKMAPVQKVVKKLTRAKKGKKTNVVKGGPRVYETSYTTYELDLLTELRAIGLTFRECGVYLGRSKSSCCSAAIANNIQPAVDAKKAVHVKDTLNRIRWSNG
jgi:hypothetical protein